MKSPDRWLVRILNRMLDATMVNCEACKQFTVEHEWATPDSVAVIPNGLDLARFRECSAEVSVGKATRERRIGIVANLRPVKNLDLLVRAAALLKASHPNLRFQIAGEGDSRAELESLIVELGLQERFDLLGAVSDIPAFLRTLDVAVLCSRSEGSPNSIMEYMAAARPIVATAVGGCTELLQHEQNGLLVPPSDFQQLAAGIDRLLQNRELAVRLGTNARRRALAEYGVDLQARRYEDFYRDLMQKKRLRGGRDSTNTSSPRRNNTLARPTR
jgi:glycosyltransferase involved in cell wall biosynthesis